MNEIFKNIKEVTLGYALITLSDNNDLDHGPMMKWGVVNPRDVNHEYLKQHFKAEVSTVGLQNHIVLNTIMIGVNPKYIKPTSLQPLQEGMYNNHVQWNPPATSAAKKRTMVLYNGNHHCMFMQMYHNDILTSYARLKKARAVLDSSEQKDNKEWEELEEEIWRMTDVLDFNGVWLVHFLDECK